MRKPKFTDHTERRVKMLDKMILDAKNPVRRAQLRTLRKRVMEMKPKPSPEYDWD